MDKKEKAEKIRLYYSNEMYEESEGSVLEPVIAEGKIDTPEKAKRVLELGVFCVVVGGAITRPQLITKAFSEKIKEV